MKKYDKIKNKNIFLRGDPKMQTKLIERQLMVNRLNYF